MFPLQSVQKIKISKNIWVCFWRINKLRRTLGTQFFIIFAIVHFLKLNTVGLYSGIFREPKLGTWQLTGSSATILVFGGLGK